MPKEEFLIEKNNIRTMKKDIARFQSGAVKKGISLSGESVDIKTKEEKERKEEEEKRKRAEEGRREKEAERLEELEREGIKMEKEEKAAAAKALIEEKEKRRKSQEN